MRMLRGDHPRRAASVLTLRDWLRDCGRNGSGKERTENEITGGKCLNGEGYRDPTADQAVRNVSRMPRRIKDVVRAINTVASLHGLEIVVVRDRHTGKEWRM